MSSANTVWRLRGAVPTSLRPRIRRAVDASIGRVIGSLHHFASPDAIALTFDDGPDPIHTPAILDALADGGVRATFFVLAGPAAANPGLVRRIIAEGHELGLHGHDHQRPAGLSKTEVKTWLARGLRSLERVAGQQVRLFRPPYGSQSLASHRAARRAGLTVVAWSAHAADWESSTAESVAARAASVRPGDILLLHDGIADAGAAVPGFDRAKAVTMILQDLHDRGLRANTVGHLLQTSKPLWTAWFRP